MTVVYDLKREAFEWLKDINSTIEEECPEYFLVNPAIASSAWWESYDKNQILKVIRSGKITFLGERADWSNHIAYIVEICCNGELVEYEICENWEFNCLTIGHVLEVEEFSIKFAGRYGPYIFKFIKRVEIKGT
ncbi:MAG: hypothetical protein U1F46_08145 [Marinagarivorans sp.]